MQKSQEKAKSFRGGPLEKKAILVVDDSLEMLELREIVLEMGGFNVFTSSSGTEALELLKHQHIDLILLDISMDDMSGPEFLKRLESEQPDIINKVPVVFLTGMDKEEIPQTKASGVITKTVGTDEFLDSVRYFLRIE